jgi:two-component system NtrC family sensor kinase
MFSTGEDTGKLVDLTAEACDLCHAAGEPLVRVDAPSRVREYREHGRRVLGMITPIYNEPACSNADCHAHPESRTVLGVLDISVPLDRVDAEVAGIRTRSLLVGAVSVFLVGVFLMFFTRRFVSSPVGKLIDAIHTETRTIPPSPQDQQSVAAPCAVLVPVTVQTPTTRANSSISDASFPNRAGRSTRTR